MAKKEVLYAYCRNAEEVAKQRALCRRDGFEPKVYGIRRIISRHIIEKTDMVRYEVRAI
jgi:hypothetical protein